MFAPDSSGSNSDGRLRIATSLRDVPAELIAEIYKLRSLIELFFRMFNTAPRLSAPAEYETKRR